jgi:hypothetical protein
MSSRPRTSGVTILGIIMIVFGLLGLGAWPLTVASRELGSRTAGGRNVQDLIWEGSLSWWMTFSLAVATLLASVLLASGLGVLKRRPWAQKTALGYGIGTIAFGLIGQLMNVLFLYPKLIQMVDSANPVERAGAAGGMLGGIVGGLFGMILPVVVVYVVTRPSVKAELGVEGSSEAAS